MLQSTHYNLNLAEGTDLVNPLTIDVPNYQTIDSAMFANEQAGVGTATELKSGTIHAITRANTNRNVFRFKSTSLFLAGDTFTVDGGTVTALYPDGSSLKDRCFIVGSDVLCLLDGSQLTVLATYFPDANSVEYSNGVSVKDKIDNLIKFVDIDVALIPNTSDIQPFNYLGMALVPTGVSESNFLSASVKSGIGIVAMGFPNYIYCGSDYPTNMTIRVTYLGN